MTFKFTLDNREWIGPYKTRADAARNGKYEAYGSHLTTAEFDDDDKLISGSVARHKLIDDDPFKQGFLDGEKNVPERSEIYKSEEREQYLEGWRIGQSTWHNIRSFRP